MIALQTHDGHESLQIHLLFSLAGRRVSTPSIPLFGRYFCCLLLWCCPAGGVVVTGTGAAGGIVGTGTGASAGAGAGAAVFVVT